MKYLFDLSSIQPRSIVEINGGGLYAFSLFKEIFSRYNQNHELDVLLYSKYANNTEALKFFKEHQIKVIYFNKVSTISDIVSVGKYDVLVLPVCSHYYSKLKVNDSVKVVTIIHDLFDLSYKSLHIKYGKYPKRDGLNLLRRCRDIYKYNICYQKIVNENILLMKLNKKQSIFTVSNFTKNSFKSILKQDDKKIKVYYPMECRKMFPEVNSISFEDENRYQLKSKKYFLFISACRWTKNNAIAIFALDNMFSSAKYQQILNDYKVLVLGVEENFTAYYKRRIKNLDRFVFDGYVDENQLQLLYANAYIFVFPSVLEGFGLPPVEAMKYGTVSACSNAMSIPEVCGESVFYFDPYKRDSIISAINDSLNKEKMQMKIEKAKERYKELTNKRNLDLNNLITDIMNC